MSPQLNPFSEPYDAVVTVRQYPSHQCVPFSQDLLGSDGRSKLELVEFKIQLLQKYKQQLKLKEQEFLRTVETLMRRIRKYVDETDSHPVNGHLKHLLKNWDSYGFEGPSLSL